jgi:hypothetical protein
VSSEAVFRGETHATNFVEEPTQQESLLKVFVKPKFTDKDQGLQHQRDW